ncbi:YitT family protein [Salirhabdus sp. Marseille-P4669]|uniref:YitT family protein n=1 Tax=Salirhabdus sp. Marseille-P4669 TaxID=2042310 RepID=UPI000C7BA2A1|nr:YitT family protein [Salirhabdus sp. Marseille-P4669]
MVHLIEKGLLIMLGGITQGFGMGLFLFPNDIPSGGAGGITVILHHLFQIDPGIGLWIVNFSLMIFGIKYLGNKSTVGTLLAITVTSISIIVFENMIHISVRNLFIDLFIGSIFLGVGIGILMRQGVSNGGVGVIALIIAMKRSILPGKPLFWTNSAIFLLTASMVSWQIFLLAFISQWISTKLVDLVCTIQTYETYTLDWRKKT